VPKLRELQLGFAAALLAESGAQQFAPCVWDNGLSATARLRIYRNNRYASLSGALAAVFPVIGRLVGEACFARLAHEYVRAQPSLSGDIHHYGHRFGEFLAGIAQLRDYPYLPDVAELEWAYHAVFHTEPRAASTPAVLHQVPGEWYPELRFALQPAARLLASEFPVLRIWQVNQPDWRGEDGVDLGEGGSRVLVMRRGTDIQFEPLDAAEFAWLAALQRGDALRVALEEALALDPAFDLGAALARRFAGGVIVTADSPPAAYASVHLNP
jgi:hypothetical protein